MVRSHVVEIGAFAVLIGIFGALLVLPLQVFDPANVSWLMQGDPATHFLGWGFFRLSPWSSPLGLNPGYGMEIGSSIVFTDSIPLLALVFKVFNGWLPETFQYFGVWLLLCFILQGFFAFRLVSLVVPQKLNQILAVLLFVFAPPFLFRFGGHYALCAQWTVLAALYLYFSTNTSNVKNALVGWVVLAVVTTLIHPYLLVMVAAIWVASLFDLLNARSLQLRTVVWYTAVALLVITGVMWQAGYFVISKGLAISEYGYYKMNLLSLIDSDDKWSRVLPNIPQKSGDNEGFNYLGLGVISLMLLLVQERNIREALRHSVFRHVGLLVACALLTVLAVSNHVAFSKLEVVVFDFPENIARLLQTFRSSGRFFWPVYYLIFFALLSYLFAYKEKHIATITLSLGVLIQLLDTSPALASIRDEYTGWLRSNWSAPLKEPFWEAAGSRYRKILVVPPQNMAPNYAPLAYFAVTHGMTINVGYFARVDAQRLDASQQRVASDIDAGRFDNDALYIFNDTHQWIAAQQVTGGDITACVVDGLYVVAPGFSRSYCGYPE